MILVIEGIVRKAKDKQEPAVSSICVIVVLGKIKYLAILHGKINIIL
jgi:hypothetical protein